MSDPLSNLAFKESGGGDLFVKINSTTPAKLRVLTTDPLISMDNYGNTRYSFVVWSFDHDKAMILSKGASIAKGIQALHTDEDYDEITKLDIKISATGEGMDTRYTMNVLPKTTTLTTEQIAESNKLDLEKVIKNGIYASQYNQGAGIPKNSAPVDELGNMDPIIEDIDDEPIDLSTIPF